MPYKPWAPICIPNSLMAIVRNESDTGSSYNGQLGVKLWSKIKL